MEHNVTVFDIVIESENLHTVVTQSRYDSSDA